MNLSFILEVNSGDFFFSAPAAKLGVVRNWNFANEMKVEVLLQFSFQLVHPPMVCTMCMHSAFSTFAALPALSNPN